MCPVQNLFVGAYCIYHLLLLLLCIILYIIKIHKNIVLKVCNEMPRNDSHPQVFHEIQMNFHLLET